MDRNSHRKAGPGLVLLVFLSALFCVGAAAAQAWLPQAPNGGPPAARTEHTAVYDAANNKMIMYGGCENFGDCPTGDVWVLSNANGASTPSWADITPESGPPARELHSAVYSAAGNRMIVFGGFNCSDFCTYLNEVWVLSNANGNGTPSWNQVIPATPNGSPLGRYGHTAVYDPADNTMIVFGGFTCNDFCGFLNDVWVLSNADNREGGGTPTWSQVIPATPNGSPSPRSRHTAVYDPASHSMIVYGGCSDEACLADDVWVLSNADNREGGGTPTWTQLNPATPNGSPGAREEHTAVYDPAGNAMIVFGGFVCGNGCGNQNDVWVLSNANNVTGGAQVWTQINPDTTNGSPIPRAEHTAVYDAASNAMIVFGGSGGSCEDLQKAAHVESECGSDLNDVWVLADASPSVNIKASIDIRPRIAVNTISLTHGTDIPVAILSSASFNAPAQVDRTSLTFGHAGSEASFITCNNRATDVNGDGYLDLTCHFNGTQAGFVLGDTTGYLQGKTTVGNSITGSDSVNITQY